MDFSEALSLLRQGDHAISRERWLKSDNYPRDLSVLNHLVDNPLDQTFLNIDLLSEDWVAYKLYNFFDAMIELNNGCEIKRRFATIWISKNELKEGYFSFSHTDINALDWIVK